MLLHDWPVPDNVAIAITDRHGGVSLAPYDSLNLGLHVGMRRSRYWLIVAFWQNC